MTNKKEIKDLGYLGRDAQIQLVKALFEDTRTFGELYGVIDPNYFSEQALRVIVGSFCEYYKEKGLVPSYNAILLRIRQKGLSQIDTEELEEYLNAVRNAPMEEIDNTVELGIQFCKQQKALAITNKMLDMLKKGYNGTTAAKLAYEMLDIDKGIKDMEDFNPMNVVDEVLLEEQEIRVPTGIKELDEVFNGGLSKGSLAMLQANAGCGKTTFSCIFANRAAALGYNVLQIFFEDRKEDMARKHYSAIVPEASINMFIHPFEHEMFSNMVKTAKGFDNVKKHLDMVKLPTGTKTVEDIANVIRMKINQGFVPDMVIIDYFDCLKMSSNPIRDKWDAETSAMRKLENLAHDENIALWVMQQGNRNGETENEGVSIQGAYTKLQIASIYVTVSRLKDEQERNMATIRIRKNRQGRVCTMNDVYLNNGTMEIDMSGAMRTDDRLMYKEDGNER